MEDIKVLNWDDEIVKDSDFVLLPEGEYPFKVINFERAWYEGGEKLPACNKAIITLKVNDEVELKENFYLTSKTEGLLAAFFTAIGQKKKGEPLKMNWGKVIGSTGKVKIKVDKYNGSEFNRVSRWISPDDNNKPTAGFTPGAF